VGNYLSVDGGGDPAQSVTSQQHRRMPRRVAKFVKQLSFFDADF
jgi:hypothetical protein